MVQVIKPTQVIEKLTTQTVQGEVTINLNLTITLKQDGTVALMTEAAPTQQKNTAPEDEIPDTVFQIPDFESAEVLSDFGKDTAGR